MKQNKTTAILILTATAITSFLVFLLTDSAAWFLFLVNEKNSIRLGLHAFLYDKSWMPYAVLLYGCAGMCIGLPLTVLYLLRTKAGVRAANPCIAALSVCLAANTAMNFYAQLPSVGMPRSIQTVLFAVVFLIVCLGVKPLLRSLLRRRLSVLISASVALEVFWTIPRYWQPELLCYGISLALSALLFFGCYGVLLAPAAYKNRTAFLCFVLLAAFFWPVRMGQSAPQREQLLEDRPNIILIVMDTTRADHLSCYGYHRKATPRVDELAAQGVRYERAYATAPWTLPSLASILTGTYPGFHGANRSSGSDYKLEKSNETLPEMLSRTGYATAGFVSNHIAGWGLGLAQGFQTFNETFSSYGFLLSRFGLPGFLNSVVPLQDYLVFNGYLSMGTANRVNRMAIPWLKEHGGKKPFFLYLHYFDPHNPYQFDGVAEGSSIRAADIREKYGKGRPNYLPAEYELFLHHMFGQKTMPEAEKNFLKKNYVSEVIYMDKHIGELLDAVKAQGLYDSTMIIVTADHGEAFGEHNLFLHGIYLYNDNLHVPLIIKYPKSAGIDSGVVNYPVSLTGIVPTVLAQAGIDVPAVVQGVPFSDEKNQPVISQCFPMQTWDKVSKYGKIMEKFKQPLLSLIEGDYKYIVASGGQSMLFNLSTDPFESDNLLASNAAVAEKMKKTLNGYTLRLKLSGKEKKTGGPSREAVRNLRALGYLP